MDNKKNSIHLTTNGTRHLLMENDAGDWSSDYFDYKYTVESLLEMANEEHDEEKLLSIDTCRRIRLLEKALSMGVLNNVEEVKKLNKAIGQYAHISYERAMKLCMIQFCDGHFSDTCDDHSSFNCDELTGYTLARMLIIEYLYDYKQIGLYSGFLLKEYFDLYEQHPMTNFSTGISGIHPMFHFDRSRQEMSLTSKKVVTVMKYILDTMANPKSYIFNTDRLQGNGRYVTEAPYIKLSQWTDCILLAGWYETACWEGYGQDVLPVFLESFDVIHDERFIAYTSNDLSYHHDAMRDKVLPVGTEYWKYLLTTRYPGREFIFDGNMTLLWLFVDFIMIRTLNREYWGKSHLFPTSDELIDAVPSDSVVKRFFVRSLKMAQKGYAQISQNSDRYVQGS